MSSDGLAYADSVFYKTVDLLASISPSTRFANTVAEPHRGLPFARHLAMASKPRHRRRLTGTIAPPDTSRPSLWRRMGLLEDKTMFKNSVYGQGQSQFFTKLPPEIRLKIYEFALGGYTYFVEAPHLQQSLRATTRTWQIADTTFHRCVYPDLCAFCKAYKHFSNLALIMTCRRVYNEAAEILYRDNAFEFHQMSAAFQFLQPLMSRDKLHCVRRFSLQLRMPRHPLQNARTTNDWYNLWSFFEREMTGLRRLVVDLHFLEPVKNQITSTPDSLGRVWTLPMINMAAHIRDHHDFGFVLMIRGIAVFTIPENSSEAAGEDEEVLCVRAPRRKLAEMMHENVTHALLGMR